MRTYRSVNEFGAAITKAAIAAGHPYAVADDIAAAAILLHKYGYDGVAAVLASIDNPVGAGEESSGLRFKNTNAAGVGMAAAETALATDAAAHFENVDSPLLLIGLIALAAKNHTALYHLYLSDNRRRCHLTIPDRHHLLPRDIPLFPSDGSACACLTVDKTTAVAPPPYTPPERIEVADATWKRIETLMQKIYVAAAYDCRSANAGAGEIDND